MNSQQIYQLLASIIQSFSQSFVSQMLVITIVYFIVWKIFAPKFKHFRIQPVKRAGSVQIQQEIKNSVIVVLAGGSATKVMLRCSDG